jgi:isoamylase
MQLCVFPNGDTAAEERIEMRRVGDRFACAVHGLPEHVTYGYRAHGAWAPAEFLRFNPHKLLLDPMARSLRGSTDVRGPLIDHLIGDPRKLCMRDSAAFVSHAVLEAAPPFDWQGDSAPRIPWDRTVIYEAHVKGLTQLHPRVPESLRGTFAGLGTTALIDHLQSIGVTTLELLPVSEELTEPAVTLRGLSNYWGYSTAAYCVPARRFARPGVSAAHDLKESIRLLHAANIEVVLDIVLNHTAELGADGPTLSFRGLCNRSYYRQLPGGAYDSVTGCGNAMAADEPLVIELWLDVLRYWVTEFHVDGFRFDLAATLARSRTGFAPVSSFMTALALDPVLRDVKLIMEPWDLGAYRLGTFPPGCPEWNDRFRECVRGFFRGERALVAELASRFAGSQDLFAAKRVGPTSSVNYVVSHDGFTLADLVRYSKNHNLANGEQNRDGDSGAGNVNYGVEGPSDDPRILAMRARHQRSLLATLLLSLGVPMLAAGDEFGRTQFGNSNAYCQDNELSYVDWVRIDPQMLACVQALTKLRAEYPELRRERFLSSKDVTWSGADGKSLTEAEWRLPRHALLIARVHRQGGDLICVLHGELAPARVHMHGAGRVLFDSAEPEHAGQAWIHGVVVAPRAVVLLLAHPH